MLRGRDRRRDALLAAPDRVEWTVPADRWARFLADEQRTISGEQRATFWLVSVLLVVVCVGFVVVIRAIMPQPMSTPTAAGTMAPFVATTEPTVAPMPQCTSGMAAMCWNAKGRRAVFSSFFHATSSTWTPRVQLLMGTPPPTWRSMCGEARVCMVDSGGSDDAVDDDRPIVTMMVVA